MAKVMLTDRLLASARPGPELFDATVKGLALRVQSGGQRSLVFNYPLAGKRVRLVLGSYPALSLAAARGKAIEARRHLEQGLDPRAVMGQEKAVASMTVADLIASYSDKHL